MSAGFPRWLLVLVGGLAIVAAAVWATTPAVVPAPTAAVWAACFEPIALDHGDDDVDLMLVRRPVLDGAAGSSDHDPAVLLANAARPIRVELDRTEQEAFADGLAELPQGRAVAAQAAAAWLERGRLEVRRSDGSRFLIGAGQSPAQFELDPEAAYPARLTRATAASPDGTGRVILPAGTEVEIALPPGQPVAVEQIRPLWGAPLVLPEVAASLAPDVQPSRETAPFLRARLTAPGLDFDRAKDGVRACLWFGDDAALRLPVASVQSPVAGVAEVALDLPREPFPWLDWRRGRTAGLAVVTTDGRYAGIGEFVYLSRSWALVLATALAALLFVGLVWLRNAGAAWKTWLMGLFLGEDRQPSLSLFQILLWTIVTVWALLYVFFSTGNLLTMTPQVMALLGFAGAGSLAARWVAASRAPAPPTPPGDEAKPPAFWAILENNGQLDLFKLQLFLFTVLIAGYVVFRVVRQSAFPALDPEFLMLMGVSNSLYVGSKLTQASPLAVAQALRLEWDVLRLRVDDLEKETAALEAESEALQQAMTQEKDRRKKQELADQKSLLDRKLVDLRAEAAKARSERAEREAKYKEAVAALAPARTTA